MPKWAGLVLVVVAFFVVAALAERRRVTRLDAWCRSHGFVPLDPFVPGDHQPVAKLAAHVTGRAVNSLAWAPAIAGMAGDAKVTLAMFSYTPTGRKTSRWFTLAVWEEASPKAKPQGGQFALHGGYAGWMTEGLLSATRADQVVTHIIEARRSRE